MTSPAYQQTQHTPTIEIGAIGKRSFPSTLDSPGASYATLMEDELHSRGQPVTQKAIAAILLQVAGARTQKVLKTPRLQLIWAEFFSTVSTT